LLLNVRTVTNISNSVYTPLYSTNNVQSLSIKLGIQCVTKAVFILAHLLADPSPPFTAEVKNRVELYLDSP
jgi:hypothetical protein